MDRAKEVLRALLSLIPETVRVARLAGAVTIPAAQVRELDVLIVGAGERVATDGVVVEGRSSLDTSAVTDEPIPDHRCPGRAAAERQGRRRSRRASSGSRSQHDRVRRPHTRTRPDVLNLRSAEARV